MYVYNVHVYIHVVCYIMYDLYDLYTVCTMYIVTSHNCRCGLTLLTWHVE